MRQAVKGARAKKALTAYKTEVTRKLKKFDFDFWDFWQHAVKHLKISPTEAWRLDYAELMVLIGHKENSQDTSLMLQYERKMNGAPKKITEGLY